MIIPADKEIKKLVPGQVYTNSTSSWMFLVPPARLQEILHKLAEKDYNK